MKKNGQIYKRKKVKNGVIFLHTHMCKLVTVKVGCYGLVWWRNYSQHSQTSLLLLLLFSFSISRKRVTIITTVAATTEALLVTFERQEKNASNESGFFFGKLTLYLLVKR
jgi:hypothetical protein